MFIIGICDDISKEQQNVYNLCEKFFNENKIEHKYIFFSNGEDVLKYCEAAENERIDLLFLDVEMSGISGIELKDKVISQNMIWRISFVTSHTDSVYGAFSQKTIGFIPKPPSYDKVSNMINIVSEELKKDAVITFKGYNDEKISVKLEDIAYFKANGSYTEVFTYSSKDSMLISKKIGDIEKELDEYFFVRVHKSYLVNLENVIDVGGEVYLRDKKEEIPIGRKYKDIVKNRYLTYGRNKINKRL